MVSVVGLVGIPNASEPLTHASQGSGKESLLIGNKVPIVLPKQQSLVSQRVLPWSMLSTKLHVMHYVQDVRIVFALTLITHKQD